MALPGTTPATSNQALEWSMGEIERLIAPSVGAPREDGEGRSGAIMCFRPGCKNVATHKCDRCARAFYCSKGSQKNGSSISF
jgi:hypothetical protein